jgi:hypothetical protein
VTTTSRRIAALLAALVALLALPLAAPAGAQELFPGLQLNGAVVTTPGEESRTLDADEADSFMRAWLLTSVFGNVGNEDPPAELPVSRVEVDATFRGADQPFVVLFATRGTEEDSWVGMPPQSLGFGSVDEERWIHAPLGTYTAFLAGEQPPATTVPQTTAPDRDAAGGSDDDDFPLVVVLVSAVAVALGLGALLVNRRRGAPA